MANKILIGADQTAPLYTFTDATIREVPCILSAALSGDELAIDQLMPVVYSAAYIRVRFVPKGSTGLRTADGKMFYCYPGAGFLDKLPYGTPIWYYSDDTLIGKFYSKRVVRSGKTWFDIMAVSAVGILDGQRHYGGIYTGQTFQTVASEIIGDTFSFSCADNVAGINIYGWLPIASRRENLHQLLFACGVALAKDAGGEMLFRYPDSDTVKHVPDNRIFLGGSVDYLTPATRAEVTEHSFMALSGDETVTLYDNSQGGEVADNTLVSFQDAPIHDLSVSGSLTIVESGVNYAIISGSGVLTGKRYTHITRVLRRDTGTNGEVKEVSVSEATLVNVANSENVLKRVLSYYASARMIACDLVVGDEKPGDQISFNNPYSDPERAFLASMDIRASSFLRASCELITGYLPSGGGNNYTQVVVLEGAGTWTSPVSGKIRVAVTQGGWGGDGGHRGGKAEDTMLMYAVGKTSNPILVPNYLSATDANRTQLTEPRGNPGKGGLPGNGGQPGKVFVITLDVVKGQQFAFHSGVGGIGGLGETTEQEATTGTEGTHSTFGQYTSEDGVIMQGGYMDIINNVQYAVPGEIGETGGDGFKGGYTETDDGAGVKGGKASSGKWQLKVGTKFYIYEWQCAGGGQGGNAFGVRGGDGETQADTYDEDVELKRNSPHCQHSSYGGIGATPITSDKPQKVGCGGRGGHGGGGGGTAGTMKVKVDSRIDGSPFYTDGGIGGDGSNGADGADGGIIIYL